jgi:hypothetical protein
MRVPRGDHAGYQPLPKPIVRQVTAGPSTLMVRAFFIPARWCWKAMLAPLDDQEGLPRVEGPGYPWCLAG